MVPDILMNDQAGFLPLIRYEWLIPSDIANAPESSSTATYQSHGARNIALGAANGGTVGVAIKATGASLLSKKVVDRARVRHHTSVEGAKAIKRTGAINPSRGGGVHVETMPFKSPKTASAKTGAFGKGAYIEFNAPRKIIQKMLDQEILV